MCGGEQCSRQGPGGANGDGGGGGGGLASSALLLGPHHPHIDTTMPRCLDQAIEEVTLSFILSAQLGISMWFNLVDIKFMLQLLHWPLHQSNSC